MFKSIADSFRAFKKPGSGGDFTSNAILSDNQYVGPVVENNNNIDPLADNYGNQWVRDASDPQAYQDAGNLSSMSVMPTAQAWSRFPNFDVPQALGYWIGQATIAFGDPPVGVPSALYDIRVSAFVTVGGVPQVWSASPLYLFIYAGPGVAGNNEGVYPVAGSFPSFSLPIPRPPEYLQYTPGVKTPLNAVNGLGGGFGLFLSSDPFVYLQPAVVGESYFFGVDVSWAYYK